LNGLKGSYWNGGKDPQPKPELLFRIVQDLDVALGFSGD